jgi:hypothetical protein
MKTRISRELDLDTSDSQQLVSYGQKFIVGRGNWIVQHSTIHRVNLTNRIKPY